ncbi:MAG TPA: hypothetical protein VFE65_32450 [Pseudonocardia sp.]|nr:hypothetical protein [Pseudonocardia sp.]
MTRRIGLVVPGSTVTVETELPALLARHTESFSFHPSRTRALTSLGPDPVLAGVGTLLTGSR